MIYIGFIDFINNSTELMITFTTLSKHKKLIATKLPISVATKILVDNLFLRSLKYCLIW
jgi:hypothetical protein